MANEVSQIVVTASTNDIINFRPVAINFFNNPNYFLNGSTQFYDTQWIYPPAPDATEYEYSYGVRKVTSDGSAEGDAILENFQAAGTLVFEAMGPAMEGYNVQFPALPGIPTNKLTISVTALGAQMEAMNFRVVSNSVNFGTSRGGANVFGNVSVRANTLVGYAAQYQNAVVGAPTPWLYGYVYLYLHEIAHNTPAGVALNTYYGNLHYAQYHTYDNYNETSQYFRDHEMAIHQLAYAIGHTIGYPIPATAPFHF